MKTIDESFGQYELEIGDVVVQICGYDRCPQAEYTIDRLTKTQAMAKNLKFKRQIKKRGSGIFYVYTIPRSDTWSRTEYVLKNDTFVNELDSNIQYHRQCVRRMSDKIVLKGTLEEVRKAHNALKGLDIGGGGYVG